MVKKCSKCGKTKNIKFFSACKCNKDGLQYYCKLCRKKYRDVNKVTILDKQKKHYYKNRDNILKHNRAYRADNRKRVRELNKEYCESIALYSAYKDKLTVDESPRCASDAVSLEVKCRYCGNYFYPLTKEVNIRVRALNGTMEGECSLYCSDNCKESCPIYNKKLYPKGFKKASSREVDPLLRQMCFERDNWECQICGKSTDVVQLHCHHIQSYTLNKIRANDIDNVVTLCKECHKEVHKLPGCHYYQLKCVSSK